jgi:hypothetical protein
MRDTILVIRWSDGRVVYLHDLPEVFGCDQWAAWQECAELADRLASVTLYRQHTVGACRTTGDTLLSHDFEAARAEAKARERFLAGAKAVVRVPERTPFDEALIREHRSDQAPTE